MARALEIGTAGSGVQQVSSLYVGTVSSGRQQVLAGYVGTAGSGVQQFYAALTAVASPASVSASGSIGMHLFSPVSTCTASNGSGSYSYAWSLNNTGDGSVAFSGSSAVPSPAIQFTGLNSGDVGSADLICTVTDTVSGFSVQSNTVTASYSRL
jgi:hypothetical protein